MNSTKSFITASAVTLFSLGIGFGPSALYGQSAERQAPAVERQQTVRSTETRTTRTTSYTNAQLEGRQVVAQGGEEIGKVDSLAIDLASGEVAYAVVASGGVLGLNADLRAVPIQAIEVTPRGDELIVQLNTTPDRWESLPVVAREDIANLCEPQRAQQIFEVFDLQWADRPAAKLVVERTAPQPADCRLVLTNALSDRMILGSGNQELGEIENVVVDLESGQLEYVLVAPETRFFWNRSDDVFALSPRVISSVEEERIVVDVNEQQLQEAQQLTVEQVGQADESMRVFRMQREDVTVFGGRSQDDSATRETSETESQRTRSNEQREMEREQSEVNADSERTSEFGSPQRDSNESRSTTGTTDSGRSGIGNSDTESNVQIIEPGDQNESRSFGRPDRQTESQGRALGRDGEVPGRVNDGEDRQLPKARDAERHSDQSAGARDLERRQDPGAEARREAAGQSGPEYGSPSRNQGTGATQSGNSGPVYPNQNQTDSSSSGSSQSGQAAETRSNSQGQSQQFGSPSRNQQTQSGNAVTPDGQQQSENAASSADRSGSSAVEEARESDSQSGGASSQSGGGTSSR